MTNQILLNVAEPVAASNVPTAIGKVPGLPVLSRAVCRGLTVELFFETTLSASDIASLNAYAAVLPLVSRVIRYAKMASEGCRDAIMSGVESNATGTMYWYDTDVESQLNMVGAVVSQTNTYWHVRVSAGADKIPVIHTPAELVAVGQSMKAWKETRILVFQQFRATLSAATSTTEADDLFAAWDAYAEPALI